MTSPSRDQDLSKHPNKYAAPQGLELAQGVAHFRGYQEFRVDVAERRLDPLTDALRAKAEIMGSALTPAHVHGRTVLDLGGNNGYFAFEALLAGATSAGVVEMDATCVASLNRYRAHHPDVPIAAHEENVERWSTPADVVIALALVHWIYSCTADTRSLDVAVGKLASLARDFLIVEWVDPTDPLIESYRHTEIAGGGAADPYDFDAFMAALRRRFRVVRLLGELSPSRRIFLAARGPIHDLSWSAPLRFPRETLVSSRRLWTAGGVEYWSRVHAVDGWIYKQASPELAQRELAALRLVEDPGVVRGEIVEEQPAFVLARYPRAEGLTLDQLGAQAPLARDEVLKLADRLLEIVGALRRAGVIHRDLHPANILVAPDGAVRLIDFGWATAPGFPDVTPSPLGEAVQLPASGSTIRIRPPEGGGDDLFAVGRIIAWLNHARDPDLAFLSAWLASENLRLRPSVEAARMAIRRVLRGGRPTEPGQLDLEGELIRVVGHALEANRAGPDVRRALGAEMSPVPRRLEELRDGGLRLEAQLERLRADVAAFASVREELEAARARLEDGERARDAARSELSSVRRDLESAGARLEEVERARDAARSELSSVRQQLESAEGRSRVRLGELASAREEVRRLEKSGPARVARVPGRLAHAVAVAAELAGFALRGRLREGLRLRGYARLIRRSWLFDVDHYLAQCGGDPEARRDPVRHYLLRGAAMGLDPNPFFDSVHYVERHPSAARYGKNPLVHYVRYGAREGLSPSPRFDAAWYVEHCPGARESGLLPLSHFLVWGRAAGFPPAPVDEAGPRAPQPVGRGPAAPAGAPPSATHGDTFLEAPGLAVPPEDRVLVVDHRILTPDQDSGSVRMLGIVKLLGELGHEVTFVSESEERMPDYEERLRPFAARILHGLSATRAHLEAEGGAYRHAILSRPDTTHRFLPTVRAFAPNATVVFDTVDVHWVRTQRAAELSGDPALRAEAERLRQIERVNAQSADLVLSITDQERAVIAAEAPSARLAVVPNVHAVRSSAPGPEGRAGLVFIGGFEHRPNVDAVTWFVREILPLVRRSIPDVRFHVLGSKPTEEVTALRSREVEVTGFVPEVEPYFDRGRVFVSPLRYGAGMKGKIGQAMALGLPVVTTSIGAEGMKLVDGVNAQVADSPERFAEAVVQLYRDERLWTRLAEAGRRHVDEHFSERRVRSVLAELFPPEARA